MNMYKIYLKQAWALLKENKLLSGVSIFGTALAICMIMVIVIVWQMRTANYSPEDYRDRMMYVSDTRASYKENESYNDCYLLASRVVKDCFYPLRSAEKVGMAYHGVQRLAAVVDHTVEFKCDVTFTDADSMFQVPVTRAETLDMTGRQFCFAEVFFENGNNIGCPIGNIDVSDIKTRGVFDAEI